VFRCNYYDDGVAPAAIDLHFDREGFDSIDGSGQNTGQHGRIVVERGRKGNAVFADFDTLEIDGSRVKY